MGAMYFFSDSREDREIAGEEEMREFTELETLERGIYLPTYVPFEIAEVTFGTYYVGPREVRGDTLLNLHEEEEKYWSIELIYFSKEDLGSGIRVVNADSSVILESEEIPYDEKIELAGGKVGYYSASDYGDQFLVWTIDNGIYVVEPMHRNAEPMPKEEIIKIAESFREYREGKH